MWALNSEIQTASLKGLVTDASDASDGERLAIVPKVKTCHSSVATYLDATCTVSVGTLKSPPSSSIMR